MLRIEIHLFNTEAGGISMEGVEDFMDRLGDLMVEYHGLVVNDEIKSVVIAFDDKEADDLSPDEYFNARIGAPGGLQDPLMFLISGAKPGADDEETTS